MTTNLDAKEKIKKNCTTDRQKHNLMVLCSALLYLLLVQKKKKKNMSKKQKKLKSHYGTAK